jgi:uncharacterized surface protein with fasciclin (FAS1) repeats
MSTILQIANADRSLSLLIAGIKAANLEETLSGTGPFTILAPINLAFGQLHAASFVELLKPANNVKLTEILSAHIIPEKRMVKDFINGQKLKTIGGKEVNVTVKNGEVTINGARILSRDKQGSNGVIHSLNAVNMAS